MRIFSWNVNGLRAIQKKGILDWLQKEKPDILCLQETKAQPEQLGKELLEPAGYRAYFASAERKGYSGVATYTQTKPVQVEYGFGLRRFDGEGRVLLTEFEPFTLLNIYFPNGKKDAERLQYKLDFYETTLLFVEKLKAQGRRVIVCGDYNTAHRPIDLAHPKENEKVSGFLPSERAWIDKWIAHGQMDVFRESCPVPHQYTWWDLKTGARERNVGWRIDYFFVSKDLMPNIKDAKIHPDVFGSDHCPVSIELEI
ncbi:MAG: exodeoxyribonuclease III [Candidatus Omnitrophica bacterium]|nr:exodeoxyribonuclease III [Candidatus Omnitrophota bacterium]MDD5671854.1 exodeoxyribonuclease III [Candidatus Omnitrophota bacterium]